MKSEEVNLSAESIDKVDVAFADSLCRIRALIRSLPKHLQIRCDKWAVKFHEVQTNDVLKRNRNLFAELLLFCIVTGVWYPPLDKAPPEGPLGSLPPHLVCMLRQKREELRHSSDVLRGVETHTQALPYFVPSPVCRSPRRPSSARLQGTYPSPRPVTAASLQHHIMLNGTGGQSPFATISKDIKRLLSPTLAGATSPLHLSGGERNEDDLKPPVTPAFAPKGPIDEFLNRVAASQAYTSPPPLHRQDRSPHSHGRLISPPRVLPSPPLRETGYLSAPASRARSRSRSPSPSPPSFSLQANTTPQNGSMRGRRSLSARLHSSSAAVSRSQSPRCRLCSPAEKEAEAPGSSDSARLRIRSQTPPPPHGIPREGGGMPSAAAEAHAEVQWWKKISERKGAENRKLRESLRGYELRVTEMTKVLSTQRAEVSLLREILLEARSALLQVPPTVLEGHSKRVVLERMKGVLKESDWVPNTGGPLPLGPFPSPILPSSMSPDASLLPAYVPLSRSTPLSLSQSAAIAARTLAASNGVSLTRQPKSGASGTVPTKRAGGARASSSKSPTRKACSTRAQTSGRDQRTEGPRGAEGKTAASAARPRAQSAGPRRSEEKEGPGRAETHRPRRAPFRRGYARSSRAVSAERERRGVSSKREVKGSSGEGVEKRGDVEGRLSRSLSRHSSPMKSPRLSVDPNDSVAVTEGGGFSLRGWKRALQKQRGDALVDASSHPRGLQDSFPVVFSHPVTAADAAAAAIRKRAAQTTATFGDSSGDLGGSLREGVASPRCSLEARVALSGSLRGEQRDSTPHSLHRGLIENPCHFPSRITPDSEVPITPSFSRQSKPQPPSSPPRPTPPPPLSASPHRPPPPPAYMDESRRSLQEPSTLPVSLSADSPSRGRALEERIGSSSSYRHGGGQDEDEKKKKAADSNSLSPLWRKVAECEREARELLSRERRRDHSGLAIPLGLQPSGGPPQLSPRSSAQQHIQKEKHRERSKRSGLEDPRGEVKEEGTNLLEARPAEERKSRIEGVEQKRKTTDETEVKKSPSQSPNSSAQPQVAPERSSGPPASKGRDHARTPSSSSPSAAPCSLEKAARSQSPSASLRRQQLSGPTRGGAASATAGVGGLSGPVADPARSLFRLIEEEEAKLKGDRRENPEVLAKAARIESTKASML